MNCPEARTYLPAAALFSGESAPSREEEPGRHLDQCGECRELFESVAAQDRELAARLRAVAVPADLQTELLSRLAMVQLAPPAARPTAALLRRRWLVAAALMFVVSVCSPLLWKTFQRDALTLAELLMLVDSGRSDPTGVEAAVAARPAGWSMLSPLRELSSRQISGAAVPIHAVTFQWRATRSGDNANGVLWIVPAVQFADPAVLPSLDTAELQYSKETTRLWWREGASVFLIDVQGDAHALRLLRDRLLKSRSLV